MTTSTAKMRGGYSSAAPVGVPNGTITSPIERTPHILTFIQKHQGTQYPVDVREIPVEVQENLVRMKIAMKLSQNAKTHLQGKPGAGLRDNCGRFHCEYLSEELNVIAAESHRLNVMPMQRASKHAAQEDFRPETDSNHTQV